MPTIYEEMVSAVLAEKLKQDIKSYEVDFTSSSFLITACHALDPDDVRELVKAAREEQRRLEEKANGCPSRVLSWREHFANLHG